MQTTASVSGGAGQVVPAVQRDEDGARAARPPLGRRPPLRRRTLLPGVRRLPRRAGESDRAKIFLHNNLNRALGPFTYNVHT